MQVRKIFVRSTKFLGKAILGLLLILILIIALLHLPPVQKQITRKLSTYLSSKIEARLTIERIHFSILGNVAIEELAIWDPDGQKIFSAQKIEVASSIYNLIAGDFIFDQVHIDGADVNLIQRKDGLNIQFILDAFKPKEKQAPTKSNPITLQFKKVALENIAFEFTSIVSGTSVDVNVGTFTSTEFELITDPLTLKADQVFIEQTLVNTLSRQRVISHIAEVSQNNLLLSPDFGTGIVFEINDLELKDDGFSFHQDQVTETRKFDPAHISLQKIHLSLSTISMHDDSLAAQLKSLSLQLPGFTVTDARTDLLVTRHQLALSRLHLTSGTNKIEAEFKAPNLNSPKDGEHDQIEIATQGQINLKDITYFFSDSAMNRFNAWGLTEFAVEGNYSMGKGKIKTMKLKTGSSQLQADGIINDVFDLENIAWQDVVVNASIGSEFKRIVAPYLRTINLPPGITLQLKSSGNLNKLFANGKVFTKWGNVKASGHTTLHEHNADLEVNLTGEKVDLGKWMNLSAIGPMDLSVDAKGIIGDLQNIEIHGVINKIEIMNQPIHEISYQSVVRKDNATVAISIEDANYHAAINSDILFDDTLTLTNHIQIDSFLLGKLLHADSTLTISGDTKSKVSISPNSLEGFIEGKRIIFHKKANQFSLDTVSLQALLSPSKSNFIYLSDYAKINLASNFDLRESSKLIQAWSEDILKEANDTSVRAENRTAKFNIELGNASILKLLGIDVDEFTSLNIAGNYDEKKQLTTLHATSGNFMGYGISLDTLRTEVMAHRDTIRSTMFVKNLVYNSIGLGNLDFDVLKRRDTAISNFLLSTDTSTLLGLQARVVRIDSGAWVYPDKLKAFDHDYLISTRKPVFIGKNNLAFDHLKVSRDSMEIHVTSDLNGFEVTLKNLDLTPLNFLLSPESTVINKGHLTGNISYEHNKQLNLDAHIDSLSLYNSNPLTITASAMSEGLQVPFEFQITNTSNKIDFKGNYFTENKTIDAGLLLDINNPDIFKFLVSDFVSEMSGSLKGNTRIHGPLQKPAFNGAIRFIDLELTTVNPPLTFNIADDSIELDNTSLLFKEFTLYDKDRHPLSIDGNITSKDYKSFTYDLHINSEEFTLINKPDSTIGKLRGLLVLDSDIKLKGDGKDSDIAATLKIKDATNLTLVNSQSDIELLTAEGVIDFVDPTVLSDTTALEVSTNFYDSLIASLPDFNLNAKISIEENATFRLIIDEQSGDYIKASGAADLELGYDRTGNLRLEGNYTIKNGVYRLSFYDLVKKNFTLMQGSSITWHGSPKNGDLSIIAQHVVASNSLGLIGNEIGENEKSIYKRSLDYQVGININGTIEKPIISFSLDLPQGERTNYPVLANKLDRLKQPEYQSELNKQVFGLLVLGGFLPESSGSDLNSSLVATTALSNSVNSLLASQLNRFTSQYIKGVNIDVGIQSFSDYSSPGGKTQTAMDFRVSKKMMNDRLSFEIGGDFDINQDQSGTNKGNNYRGDIAIIYDLTGNGDKQLKLFNNETYDIIYQEIRNTGISLILIREFASKEEKRKKDKAK